MENNSLDKYIRNLLADLDGGDPANSWEQLNEKMHVDLTSSEDLDFDERVKSSIGDFHAIEMADWTNFVSDLELAENLDHIDQDISLDTNFKKNLENLRTEYDPSTWYDLSHKLDLEDIHELENANQSLDQLAYDKLLNYTVPQRAEDWEALEKKLDQETVIHVPLLYKYKLAELGILTLLILVFFQANPLVDNTKQQNLALANYTTIQESEINTNIPRNTITFRENASTVVGDTNTLRTTEVSPPSQNNSDKNSTQLIVNSLSKPQVNSLSSKSTDDIKLKSSNSAIDLADAISLESSSDVTPIIKGKEEQTLSEKSNTLLEVDDVHIVQELELPVDAKTLPFGSLITFKYDEKVMQLCNSCYKPESILRWRLGARLIAKYDYIMTGYDKVFNLDSYNHSTFGYGAGLSTSILIGNWELESGFDFATRQYETRTAEIIRSISSGSLKVKLDQIQMNVLSLPLNLRYHFKDQSAKTHFYVHAGATLNVATHANYFIQSEFLNNVRRPSSPKEINQLVEESNISTDKIFSVGWFEGGTYLPNRYYYANLGFGLERKISSRYSIFGQGTYSHYLDNRGIGPNDDRFNSFSFATGIRALFK